jgi:hypothetical protein
MMMRDRNGKPLRDGVSVKLLRAAPELLRGLPDEDQQAIKWAANEVDMRMVGADDYGNVELEFKAPDGARHWIFVRPADVAAV